jgi:hypothetical protein
MKKALQIFLTTFSLTASALMGRTVMIQGNLKSFDEKTAVIETEKGLVKVPAYSIDRKHIKPGQWCDVHLDIADLVKMNPEKFKSH